MRTAILSIAALASGVLAAPGWQGRGSNFGGNWGANDNSWGNKPEGYGPGTGSWGQSSSASSSAISSSKAVESTSSVAVAPVTGVSSSSKAVSSATEVSSTSSKAVSSATGASSSSSKAVSSATGVSSSSSKAESSTILSTSVSTKPSSSPTVPGSLTFSFSKNATSSIATAPTGSAPGKVTKTTTLSETLTTYTTEVITKYTTICPVTSTHITGGSTATTTFLTTSTVTATQTATITSKVSSSPASGPSSSTKSGAVSSSSVAVSPESSSTVKTTVTDVTTIYTTVCPVTTTSVSGSSTLTSTFTTTSTVTSVTHKTITLTVPVGPSGSASGSASSGSASATTPVSPVTVSSAEHSGSASATVPNSPAITSPSGPGASSSSLSGSDVTVTDVTTVFTTVCPATTTVTNGHSTLTSTFLTTSTVTSVIKSTITLTSVSTVSPFVSTVQWGTQLLSYSVTDAITFPTSTPTTPVGPASYSRNTNSTAVGGASGTGHHKKPTSKGTSVSGKPKSTSSAKGTSASSKSTLSAVPTGSVTSKSVLSSATGSVSSKSVLPSGTGSVSSKPAVTGTGSISSKSVITSTKTSSSTTSTASSKPSESCIPCEGQPGNDPNTFCGLTINDNSYKVIPKTCKTVEYDFVITNTTFAPDGVSRLGLLVNGQMPGPKIEANWGDTIIVRVHNQLQNNGTAIHFHGQRQNYTNEMDGVPSITQCPLAPGEVQTYKFKADNYGTSWWHSHYALQIYDGVFGPMVIHGPASATYDEEQFITLQDWNHVPVDALYDISQTVGNAPGNGPQTLDTGLINGLNVFGSGGSRFNMNVESGKTYRLRLLNSAIQTTFKFYLDGHKFQVIANDYVPIKPYTTTIVNINPGQRYDVIFKADQPVGNYWLRADAQQTCTALKNAKDIKAVVSYKGAASGSPTSTAYTYTEECVDEPLASLVPVYNVPAGSQEQNIHETVLIGGNGGTPNLYKWTLSGTTFQSQYGDPTLVSIYNNGTIPAYSGNLAIEVPKLGEWVYVIIESPIPVPHPIHLHGHDFLVLAQGYGSYSSSVKLNTATPARRDSALLPGNRGQGGYLVVAFETDNPGAWLMHCHIGWHSAMGFALQIIENLGGISEWVTEGEALNDQCTNWSAFAAKDNVRVLDSGI